MTSVSVLLAAPGYTRYVCRSNSMFRNSRGWTAELCQRLAALYPTPVVAPSLDGQTGRPSQNVRLSIRHQHAQEARATATHVSLPLLPGVTPIARGGPLKNEEDKVAKDALTSPTHTLRMSALVLLLLLATLQALPSTSAAQSYIDPYSVSQHQNTLAVMSTALPKSGSMPGSTPMTTRQLTPLPEPRPPSNQKPLHRKLQRLEGHIKLPVTQSNLLCTLALSSGITADHEQFWLPVVLAVPFAQKQQWDGVQGSRRRPPGQAGELSQTAALLLHCGGGGNTTPFHSDVLNLDSTADGAEGNEEEQERSAGQGGKKTEEGNPPEQRRTKRALADLDGWTTIGSSRGFGGGGRPRPNPPLPPPPPPPLSSSDVLPLPSVHKPIQNDRVWQSTPHRLSSNSLVEEHSNDLNADEDLDPVHVSSNEINVLGRPSLHRPSSSSYWSSSSSHPPFSSHRPSFSSRPSHHPISSSSSPLSSSVKPSSFDDISFSPPFSSPSSLTTSFSSSPSSPDLSVDARLQRLDFYFAHLAVSNEDCRRKILCEVSRDPKSFAPLSTMLLEETSLEKEDRTLSDVTRLLLRTEAGARLLSYLEAVNRGKNRYRRCDVYRFGCPQEARELLNTDALIVWNEVVRWLTVKVLSKDHGGRF